MLSSSFDPAEVTWLLQDLSAYDLERGLDEREARMQGGGHYAEVLPVEREPGPAYLQLFEELTDSLAPRVAALVGAVTALVLDRRRDPVLVSLARAGTPVGVLMRRWATTQGRELPHYSLSIVRGRGIDTVALDHVLARHDPADVVFVDGWTGKGAIATELAEAVAAYGEPRLRPDLAVVADPARCATWAGTREDVLLPSACLNATVCGLVSRTVLNHLTPPGTMHGAKVYRALAPVDRTARFLDAVTACFGPAGEGVELPPTFAGLETVEKIQAEYGLPSWHLVKPSIGETTRVLLRRRPMLVLVHPDRRADLAHVEALAAERGVPVEERADMPYACVGLVRPQ